MPWSDASAVAVNVTVTSATGDGFIALSTNCHAGRTVANLSISAVAGSAGLWISNYGANVDLVIDATAVFPNGSQRTITQAVCHDVNVPRPPPPPAGLPG